MRPRFIVLLAFLFLSMAIDNRAPLHNVYFPHDSATLSGANARLIEEVFGRLPEKQTVRFGIMGSFTPTLNIYDRNRLSIDRASGIVNLLEALGAHPDSIYVADRYHEYGWPKEDGASQYEMSLQVSVTKSPSWTPPVITSIADFIPLPVQHFTIDPRKDEKITGAQGTVITIPARTLHCTDGTVPHSMDVELTEVYGASQTVNADLHTVSDGRMLESGGMIRLEANCGGKPAEIARGKRVDLSFPHSGEPKPDMETFVGRKDRNGTLNWKQDRSNSYGGSTEVRNRYYINEKQVTREEYLALKARFEEEEQVQANEEAVEANAAELDAYLLSSSELGWINCDRFYETEAVTEMVVEVDTALRPSVRLVFSDINSVLAGNYDARKGVVRFSGIPVGERIRVVGYSIVDGVPYMASTPTTVRDNAREKLSLQQTTKEGMEQQLASLR